MRFSFVRNAAFLAVVGLLTVETGSRSWAQDKKKTPPPPTPGTPTLAFSLPIGCQRGVAEEIVLNGTKLSPIVQFWPGCPAKCTIVADEKLAAQGKAKVQITVPADVPIGLYPSRVLTPSGLTNMKLFAVDELPQVVDNDANHDKAKAQEIAVPCVVAGRTDPEVSDFYRFKAKAGERLSFEILGRRLGSPIDPLIAIHGGKTTHELAYDNDSPGCQNDPRLTYAFKDAGDYVVEVRDVLGRGGADFVYRLRIGDFPLASVPVPMAAKSGSKVRVEFAGIHVDGVKPVDVIVPNAPVGSVVWVTPNAGKISGWPVPLVVTDVEESLEKEPNQNAAQATRLTIPGGVTGRFAAGDVADVYVVAVKKGQKILIEGRTQEWGSPTLLYLTVKNPKTGAELAKSDPKTPPPGDQKIEFTPPEDGDVLVEVQHLLYKSGPAEAYHLSVRPVAPSFEILLATDKTEAAAGSAATLPFTITRKGGFAGPIDVRVVGDDSVVVKIRGTQSSGILPIPSKADDPLGAHGVQVEGRSTIDGKPVAVLAHARPLVTKAMADLVYLLDLPTRVAVAVKEKAPFSLSAKIDPEEVGPGTTPTVTVTATRDPGFDAEIAINPPTLLPAGIGAKVASIPKDKTEVKFPLDVTAKAPLGEFWALLSGKAKGEKREIVSDPALLHVVVTAPFEIAVEPVELTPGGKTKVALKATRKHGYKGAINVDLKNLPPNVTGGKGTIAADKESVELELAAPAMAPPAQTEVQIVGTATGLANLQAPAGTFTLRIGKK